jgi:hypothetical protein
MAAEAAALTGNTVNLKVSYCLKAAQLLAQATLRAFALVNSGNLPAPELVLLLDNWLKNEVEVGGINITVRQHLAFGQSGKGTDDACLPGASLTA